MNKKNENINISLLENPNQETQTKMSSLRLVFRVFLIVFLFIILTFGYVLKFSAGNYLRFFSLNLVSVNNESKFYHAERGDLIVCEKVTDYSKIKQGDIVCFVSNGDKGSGEVVGFQNNSLELMINETEKLVSVRSVVGYQIKSVSVLGFIFDVVGSYCFIVVVNLALIAYVAYLTFTRINYENTEKGLYLLKKFRQEKKERQERIKIQKKLNQIHGVDYEIAQLLEFSFNENKNALINYQSNLKLSMKEKYKHILYCVHDGYIVNKELTKTEKKHISSIVELMCECKDLDVDIEYMLVDLLLKSSLMEFDSKAFTKSAKEFLNSKLDDDDMLNFASVLYVLVYKNKKLRNELKEIVDFFLQKAQYLEPKDQEFVFKTALAISKLVN